MSLDIARPSQQELDILRCRYEYFILISIIGFWVILTILVNPIGDFPLNDDWAYGYGVKSILQSGRFELRETAANIFGQAYWGALFCLPFGFSFTALRLSTLTLGAAGISALYLLLREIGGGRSISLLGSLTLAVNPVYFSLANTFMTDVPFTALTIIALWCFIRGIRNQATGVIVIAVAIALFAILIRQFAIILLVAFGSAYVIDRGLTSRALLVAILPVIAGVALHIIYQRWMIGTRRIPFFTVASFHNLSAFGPLAFARFSLKYTLYALPYLGFFTIPFLASIGLSGHSTWGRYRQRRTAWLSFTIIVGVLVAALYLSYGEVAEIGNILTPTGLGPRTLRDTFFLHQNFPTLPVLRVLWFAFLGLGVLGGAGVLLYIATCMLRVIKGLSLPEFRHELWPEMLVTVFVTCYAGLLFLVGFGIPTPLYDRYLLLLVPPLLLMILVSEIRSEFASVAWWRATVSATLLCVYGTVSVAATHDYLAWNRARWMAVRMLLDAGISPNRIDGGYEFNGWYTYRPEPLRDSSKSWWWIYDDEYVIASGPINGYHEIQRFNFTRWLNLSEDDIVVLHRAGA